MITLVKPIDMWAIDDDHSMIILGRDIMLEPTDKFVTSGVRKAKIYIVTSGPHQGKEVYTLLGYKERELDSLTVN